MAKEPSVKTAPLNIQKVRDLAKERYQDDTDLRQRMKEFSLYYQNEFWRKETGVKVEEYLSKLTANLFFSNVAQIAPLMTDSAPIWSLRPRYPYLQTLANHWSEALRYLWFTQNMDIKVFAAYVDALVKGLGLFKVWWNPSGMGEVTIDVRDAENLVFAAGYEQLWDSSWCGEILDKPLSWAWETFPQHIDKIKPTGEPETTMTSIQQGEVSWMDATKLKVRIYDLWLRDPEVEKALAKSADTKTGNVQGQNGKTAPLQRKYPNGRLLMFTEDLVELLDQASPFNHGMPPWVPLYDYLRPHSIWGMGEGDQIIGLVKELNVQLRGIAHRIQQHMHRNIGVDKSAMGPGVADAIQQKWTQGDQIFQFNLAGSNIRNVRDAVGYLEEATIPPDLGAWINLLRDLIDVISGVTDTTRGVQEKRARQSAREIDVLLETSNTRTRQRVRFEESGIKHLLRLALSVQRQYYIKPRPFSVRGDDGLVFAEASNTVGFARQLYDGEVKRQQELLAAAEESGDPRAIAMEQMATKQAMEDFEALIEAFRGKDDADSIEEVLEPEIQTNSSLPIDKQSQANLGLRMFAEGAIDRKAVLEVTQWPKGAEVDARMTKKEQQELQAKSGAPQQEGPQPRPLRTGENPTDLQDQANQLQTLQQGA